jgi:hypothetical protein
MTCNAAVFLLVERNVFTITLQMQLHLASMLTSLRSTLKVSCMRIHPFHVEHDGDANGNGGIQSFTRQMTHKTRLLSVVASWSSLLRPGSVCIRH